MSERENTMSEPSSRDGVFHFFWQRKTWWLLPLMVFILLVGILYVLGHMSSADPEMYPATQLEKSAYVRAC